MTLLRLCAKEQGSRRREDRLQQKEQCFAFGAGCHGLLWCAYLGGVVCRQHDGLLPQLPMTLRFPRDPVSTAALPECKSLEDNDSHPQSLAAQMSLSDHP